MYTCAHLLPPYYTRAALIKPLDHPGIIRDSSCASSCLAKCDCFFFVPFTCSQQDLGGVIVFANVTSNVTALAAVNSILATIPSDPMYKTFVNVSAQYNSSAALKAVVAKLSKLNVKTGGLGWRGDLATSACHS
jgi:hypothetical protein